MPPLPLLFILATVTIDAMGIGLILPVMPDLIREVASGDLAQAAIWGGVLSTAFAVMQFLFSPMVGSLSDAVGRRPVLLVSLIVMALDYVVMAVAGSIWLLLAGRIVGGITAATHSTAQAYVADVSPPEKKAQNFGLIGAGFGLGFVLGPVLGGLLAEWGTRAPFWAAAGLAGGNALLGWIVLKESVTERTRRAFRWSSANPFATFKLIGKMPGLSALLWVFFLYHLAGAVYPVIWAYYTTEAFAWSPGLIGVSLAVYGLSLAAVQGGLVRPAIARWGETRTVVVGLTIEFFSLVVIAFLTSGWALMALIPISALGAIGFPALQGIASKAVPDDVQGALQGVMASLASVAMIIAPLLMTQVFAQFTRAGGVYLPGAPFLLSSVIMAFGLVVFLRWRKDK
jgi:DHA1 family tetracycline resistance protein-like MFS transporter